MLKKRSRHIGTWQQLLTIFLVLHLVLSNSAVLAMPAVERSKVAAARAGITNKVEALPANTAPKKRSVPKVIRQQLRFSADPSDAELYIAHVLPEPLVPKSGKAVTGENRALADALLAYSARKEREDTAALSDFINGYPTSRWRSALELNVGLLRFQSGYLSDALADFRSSWEHGKSETGIRQKAIANRAISELMVLDARLGRMEELQKLVNESSGRRFEGSSELRAKRAHDGLVMMGIGPGQSFKCGPFAVEQLLSLSQGRTGGINPTIKSYCSTKQGTNLAQMEELAKKVGLKYQMAKRTKGATILVPALIHWKLGHFGALTKAMNGRYHLQDPTFDSSGSLWMSKDAIEAETDGYCLVPAGALPTGWRSVEESEGKAVWGKGFSSGPDPAKTCEFPKEDMSAGSGGSGCGCGGGGSGMAAASAFSMNASLNIKDAPLGYTPGVGPSMDMAVNYNDMEGQQPSNFTFTNLGQNWSFNWLSYTNGGIVYSARGGGYEDYSTNGPFIMSQTTLVQNGDGSYTKQFPDGSVENYTLNVGVYWFMTSVVDPQGNAVTINFDANTRITSITDASGNPATTISYVSNTVGNAGFYVMASITDGFGRSASFSYDSTVTQLLSVTDAVGNVSSFNYNGSFITSMTTPYGTTGFTKYTPPNADYYPPQGLRFSFPDGSMSVLENWLMEFKNTYFWDRHATSLYPTDPTNQVYSHCKLTRFLWEGWSGEESPVVDWIQKPLETRTAFVYPGQPSMFEPGTINKPSTVTRALIENPVQHVEIFGSPVGGDPISITFFDPGLPNGQETISYTDKSTDTLKSVAGALVSAINNDAHLTAISISAINLTNNPGYFAIRNFSTNPTLYSWSWDGRHNNVYPSFTPDPNVLMYATIGGTAHAADVLTLTVHDFQLAAPNYTESVSYTVLSGDTLTKIATGLKNALNNDSKLKTIGIDARSSGAIVKITSASYNQSTYMESTSGGATETIAYTPQAQIDQYQYNALGFATQHIDPIGRTFSYSYASNNIDLQEIRETKGTDNFLIGHWDYNSSSNPHCQTDYIDGSAQTTQYGYNSLSEIQTIKDPNNNTTTLSYNSGGYLTQIQGPLAGNSDITTFSFYGYGPVHTITDSEGYTLTFFYDNLNRLTQVTHPDGTSDQTIYDKLDAVLKGDRLGRWTRSSYDALHRLAFVVDPLGRKTQYQWCLCGALAVLTDPAGHTTSFSHDLEGRTIAKTYADQSPVNFAFEPIMGRLLTRTDALNQTTTYSHNPDNTLAQKTYTNAKNPTKPVTFTYDQAFPRITNVANGDWGTYTYAYNNYVTSSGGPAITGGGRLASITNNVIANSQVTYQYDAVGRVSNRSINGSANSTTWTYDAMSRITAEANPLGTFGYKYVDDVSGSSKGTMRLASINYPNSQATNFSWYGNTGDQRLEQISNLNPSGATLSQFNYGYDSAGEIKQWGQIQNNTSLLYNLGYDAAGQLLAAQAGSGLSGPAFLNQYYYGYDLGANRTGVQQNIAQRVRIGGTITTGNVLTVTIHDPDLTGGQEAVSYTVVSGDTLATIATKLAAAITADTKLQTLGVNAASSSAMLTIKSVSPNVTSYTGSLSNGSTETITIGATANFVENAAIGGSKTTGDVLTITVRDTALTGGLESVNYTVASGDTLSSIATGVKNALNNDAKLQTLGVTATAAATVVTIKSTSINATTYWQSTNAGATETVFLSVNPNAAETVGISGSKTTGDMLTLNFYDAALSGGKETVSYTVISTDTLTTIATAFKNAINADTNLQSIGLSATSSGTVVAITSNSTNITTYRASASTGATENITLLLPMNGTQTVAVGGTKRTSDVLTITVFDAGLTGAQQSISYTVASGDTLTTIATGIANAVNANSNLSGIGVTATSSSTVVNIKSTSQSATTYTSSLSSGSTETLTLAPSTGVTLANYNNVNELIATGPGGATTFQGFANKALKSASVASEVVSISQSAPNLSTYSTSLSTGATETLTAGTNLNGNISITVGGTVTAGNVLTITVSNANLAGGQESVFYTTITGDTTTSIATALKSAINSDAHLQAIGLTATSSGAVISVAVTGTTYTQSSTGSGATITLGLNNNGNTTATIGGAPASGNTVTITAHNPALSGGQESATYTVVTGDTVVTTAAGLAANINADTHLQALGITATNSTPAALAYSESFSAQAPLTSGPNTANVSATDGGNNTKTNGYALSLNSGSSTSLTFDANGNMTSDGTNTYSWDAENRSLSIVYPGSGNHSDFTYDGLGRNVKILEYTASSLTSTKQFVWCGNGRCEARNASSAITAQYFGYGETISGTSYYWNKDHLGSIREMYASGLQAQYSYDPFGCVSKIAETVPPDFGFAGYYLHSRSGLSLTLTRAYSPHLGIFVNSDFAGNAAYDYCDNNPIGLKDPAGAQGITVVRGAPFILFYLAYLAYILSHTKIDPATFQWPQLPQPTWGNGPEWGNGPQWGNGSDGGGSWAGGGAEIPGVIPYPFAWIPPHTHCKAKPYPPNPPQRDPKPGQFITPGTQIPYSGTPADLPEGRDPNEGSGKGPWYDKDTGSGTDPYKGPFLPTDWFGGLGGGGIRGGPISGYN